MKEKLLIIGASGHGRVVADIALKMNKWNNISFLDDDESIEFSMGIKVIGKSADVSKYLHDYDIFVGIGNNSLREKVQLKIENLGANIPVLIHPSAVIGEQVVIGRGTVVMPGVVINCCTQIGNGCIINTGTTVDHDNIIDDFVHLSPGTHLAGMVNIEKRTWLGIGSLVVNNIHIISDTKIGAGAVVICNLDKPGTYIGVPARRV